MRNRGAQGRGIGESLVSASVDIALKLGATEMYLDTPPPFKSAHRLYQRQGFIWTEEYPEVDIPDELKIDWLYNHMQRYPSKRSRPKAKLM